VQGTAERKPFTADQMAELMKLAQEGIGELVELQRNLLKGVYEPF